VVTQRARRAATVCFLFIIFLYSLHGLLGVLEEEHE
jgi:hypothetical protein